MISRVRGKRDFISLALAAALYLACRPDRTPRTLNEICMISNIKRKALSRQYRDMVIELDIIIPAVDPIKCITRIANQINLNQKGKQKININNAVYLQEKTLWDHV